MYLSRFMLFLGLIGLFCLSACDPCQSAAEKICECEKTSAERENCLRSLNLFPHMSTFNTAKDPKVCEEVLANPNCNCKAIEDGLVENCGLTR